MNERDVERRRVRLGAGMGRIGPLAVALLASACGSSGGGSGAGPAGSEPAIGTVLSSASVTPELGGLLLVQSADIEREGVALDVPAGSVAEPVTLTVGTVAEWPPESPFGKEPVGTAFVFEPTGTSFALPATLTLPIPPGDASQELFVGRWNAGVASWEKLGGTREGDYISIDVLHLSTYALFYGGASLVRVQNAGPERIELRYISGPVPPPDFPEDQPFPAYRPLPAGGVDVESGQSRSLSLLPGSYHFVVSYPSPQPGVANSLFFQVPVLESGADDAGVDQTITITPEGASSDDSLTHASIQFPGANTVPGTNQRPRVNVAAEAPPGVPVVDAITGGPVTGETRSVLVGPIQAEELTTGALQLLGTATDPEGHSPLHVAWTWSFGMLPAHRFIVNGSTDSAQFLPNPRKEGVYTVYFTAYDELGLFDEGRWTVVVEANERPEIEVIADDFIIDFGRLDEKRRPLGALPFSGPVAGVCDYIDTTGDGLVDTTVLKTLPSDGPASNPDQDPESLTCVFAIVFDPDGDELEGGFRLPTPIFGRGTIYAALPVPPGPGVPSGLLVGAIIDDEAKLLAYNTELFFQASVGALPVDTTIFPDAPPGAQALPIIWEAPDDPDSPSNTTNDCAQFGPCELSNGGTVNLLARVTDGFSAERGDYTTVGFPEGTISCLLSSVTPHPPDPAPHEGVTIIACVFPSVAGVAVHFVIDGTDGFHNETTNLTDDTGCATFFIPGGAEGVVDHVVVTCGSSEVTVDYQF